MKSQIFSNAINCRKQLRFLYDFDEIIIHPYYIGKDKNGKKVVYGRINTSNEIRKFEYMKITNIRMLNKARFSPIIPII
jgi:hypothetical protein